MQYYFLYHPLFRNGEGNCKSEIYEDFYFQEDEADILSPIYSTKYNQNCWALYIKQT